MALIYKSTLYLPGVFDLKNKVTGELDNNIHGHGQ